MQGNATRSIHRGAAGASKAAWLASATLTIGLVVPTTTGFGPAAVAQAPGPELFAKEPRTPLELWEAADYLIRTGQAAKAVPYLDKFVKSRPDDATLIAIRDRYGLGSIMRLDGDPATRPFARPVADALAVAARRYATRPERIARFVAELTQTPEEQDYAVRRLREAGPYAVPFLIEAIRRPGLSAEERGLIVRNMGRLDRSAYPALAAVLESSDPALAADTATALGMIGDPSAVPDLTFPAASPAAAPALRDAARAAIARLTGRPFEAQRRSPVQVLTAAAWSYHRHQVGLPDGPVVIWAWDDARQVPVPREVPRTEAEAILGLRYARQALRLDPRDRDAQVAQLSLALDKAIERVGFTSFPDKDQATFAAATAAGPAILGEVLETAIADGKSDLAAAAAMALGRLTDPAALVGSGPRRPHPLVRALTAPGRRVQFAAARAIVALAPSRPFPGSSQVVPALARFIVNQPLPRAVVIDGNPNRGSQMAGLLGSLGYDAELEITGGRGFSAAADGADVELVLVSFDLHRDGWTLIDALSNLQADARTAGIPLFVYGPYDLRTSRPNLALDFPGIRFLVQPLEPTILARQIGGRPAALTEAERSAYAREAAALLARIAADRRSPLAADLDAVEAALSVALGLPETGPDAATTLAELPDPDAQRSLADLALDPSRPPALRAQTANLLARSIRRFGPLIGADQEARLAATVDLESAPEVTNGLAAVIAALREKGPARSARSPRQQPGPVPAAAPGPSTAPSTPTTAPVRPGVN